MDTLVLFWFNHLSSRYIALSLTAKSFNDNFHQLTPVSMEGFQACALVRPPSKYPSTAAMKRVKKGDLYCGSYPRSVLAETFSC
jgi:hypothetical protein